MTKPRWEDAPEWANYRTKNAYGQWEWHELEPIRSLAEWLPVGRYDYADFDDIDWRESLEARPNDI